MPGAFFVHFFENFDFQDPQAGKRGKKWSRVTKNYACQTLLAFMVEMCKMIISPRVFFNVKILIFLVVKGLKGQKKWPKMLKISLCPTLCFRNHISYDLHLWYTYRYKRIISPGIFFLFFKILIFRIIRQRGGVVKGLKMA